MCNRLGGETGPLGYELERKVIPVSPSTLHAYLLVLLLGFKGMQIEEHAREVMAYCAQLGKDFGARITGVGSKLNRPYRNTNLLRPPSTYNIPVTNKDPGPDGLLNTADDTGQSITYYEYPVALQPASLRSTAALSRATESRVRPR